MSQQPTEPAMKAARALYPYWGEARFKAYAPAVAETVDRTTNLPALIVVALAAQGVVDTGRPHISTPVPGWPDGCECNECEAFDTLKSAVDALEAKT